MSVQMDLPAGFKEEMALILREELKPFLLSYGEEAARGIRPRPGLGDLSGDGLDPVPWAEGALYLRPDSRCGARVLHDAGAYYLQEPSAMAPASVLAPRPGERVLDLCAAPGGKSTQMADMMGRRGLIVANEVFPDRARILSGNIERMGIPCALVTCEPAGRIAKAFPGFFDRVLVDAPCSGEGMFRRHPESRAEWNPGLKEMCAARQAEILDEGAKTLRAGGVMVYSTCTFNETENEITVRRFLQRHPEFERLPFSLPGCPPSPDGTLRIWPHRQRGEGHFAAAMIKTENRDGVPGKRRASLLPAAETRAVLDFLRETVAPGDPDPGRIVRRGDTYCLLPEGLDALPDLRILRCGLHLAAVKGKVLAPDHALALAGAARTRVDVDGEAAAAYMTGETLPSPAGMKGWAAPCWRGVALGWVKISDGVMKNHYPRGLRRRLSP